MNPTSHYKTNRTSPQYLWTATLVWFFLFLSRSWDRYTLAVNSQYRDELQGSTCIGRLPFVLRRQMMTMSTIMRLSRMTAQMTPMMITSVSVRSVFWDCPTKHNKAQTWITMLANKAENVNKTHLLYLCSNTTAWKVSLQYLHYKCNT